jgi:Cytochrome c7 and related cytochrome c
MVRRFLTLVLLVGLVLSGVVLVGRLQSYLLPNDQQGYYEPQQPIAFSHRLHAGDLQISCQYCHYGADNSRHAGIPAAGICMNCHRFVTAPQKAMVGEILAARKEDRAPNPVVSPELQKLYDSLGLNAKLERDPAALPVLGASTAGLLASPLSPGPFLAASALFPGRTGKTPEPVKWVKVHNLPNYACFDHRAHVNAGVDCQRCHGPVETMEHLRQAKDLSMGWCVNCHRDCQRNGVDGEGNGVNGKAVQPSLDCATCHH